MKTLNIIYQAGCGGEFLAWNLGQHTGFTTLGIRIDPPNKWNLQVPNSPSTVSFQQVDTPGVFIHRFHYNDWNLDVELDVVDAPTIVLATITMESGEIVKHLGTAKNEQEVRHHTYKSEYIEYQLQRLGINEYRVYDMYGFWWNKHKAQQQMIDWLRDQLSVDVDWHTFQNFAKFWHTGNQPILSKLPTQLDIPYKGL